MMPQRDEKVDQLDDRTIESAERPEMKAAPASPSEQIGKIVAGKFEILSVIGTGGMSEVYKAKHLVLNKMIALKILQAERLKDPRDVQRFQQEALAATSLSHPNIGTVREYGLNEDTYPYIVMDFIEGVPLSVLIKKENPTPERALKIASGVCRGLEHAHSHGVIHRDIKPENILVSKDVDGSDLPVIVDFGIARLIVDQEKATRLTQTGEVFGTPSYMSPEQALGLPLDGRSDIYSLGTIMYEMLNGTRPFQADNPMTMLMKHIAEAPPPLKDIPAEIQSIVMKSMAKDPNARYQSADALRAAIENCSKNRQVIELPELTYVKTIFVRALAWIIDTLIVGIPCFILGYALCAIGAGAAFTASGPNILLVSGFLDQVAPAGATLGAAGLVKTWGLTALLFGLAVTVANYFYHAVCESSQMQGTFGKQILGLRVTSRNFRQLTFREASIRYWSKIFAFFIGLFANSFIQALSIPVLSSDQLGLIAILIALVIPAIAFRKRYQMLHDCIAGSIVAPFKREPHSRLAHKAAELQKKE